MQQKHLFIIDPIENLNLKLDTSIGIARELSLLGNSAYFCLLASLSWNSISNEAIVEAALLKFDDDDAQKVLHGPLQTMNLSSFSGIHMRKEPPFNMQYIAATWILDSVEAHCKIFNAPKALRSFNEKLSILKFPETIKPALASCNPLQLLDFAKEHCDGDAIVKPLDLFGGKGIFRLNCNEISHDLALKTLHESTGGGTEIRLMQKFNQDIYTGEVRVFTLGGKPLCWCLKKPAPGQFLANTSAGASLHTYEASESLKTNVQNIAKYLAQEGVAIVGFDIIGEVISEINITSPRLLQAEEDKANYYEIIARWFETACAQEV